MNERIRRLLGEISALEDDLRTALHEQETRLHFRIIGKRIEFQKAIRDRHRELRVSWLSWFASAELRNVVSAPFIYAMVVPFALFDMAISIYQLICFPLYRISRVRRGDYIVIDRQNLDYLNVFERLHCTYCGYANGLLAYAGEIAARTEQYWCPIKHARKVLGTHARYRQFADFGDVADYPALVIRLRAELAAERETTPS
ncbi:MAG: hypothetical protein OEV14_04295 [Gammaproteobacteria bacterium]|nr:hypothetical protein [Gammaproteobacteria bacterium]